MGKDIEMLIRKALHKIEAGIHEIKSSVHPVDYYMDVRTLSRYSGISCRKLKNLIRHQEYPLPAYKIDGCIRIKKSEFEAWLNQFRLAHENGDKVVEDIVNDIIKDLKKSA